MEIAQHLATARTLREVRERTLDIVGEVVSFDAAGIHALSPRVPLDTAVLRGVDVESMMNTVARWDALAVELAALREYAIAHDHVAADHEALSPGSRAHDVWRRTALEPQRLATALVTHFVVGSTIRGALVLGRRTRDRFSSDELAWLRSIAPTLALADVAFCGLDSTPVARLPVALACVDQRLTRRQREIVEHVALGHTNAQIAEALGLSPNTLRNHLAVIFSTLDASNRADVVRLAVLLPADARDGGSKPAPIEKRQATPRTSRR